MRIANMTLTVSTYEPSFQEEWDRNARRVDIDPESLIGDHGGSDPKIARGFLDYLLRDMSPRASMLDGRMSVAAGCAAVKSLREGDVQQVSLPSA